MAVRTPGRRPGGGGLRPAEPALIVLDRGVKLRSNELVNTPPEFLPLAEIQSNRESKIEI
jgi:hypothetical protein